MDSVPAYIQKNRQRFIEELVEFLKIPSISAKSERKADCEKAAHFLADQFRGLGLQTEIRPTTGHPVVIARSASVANKPTILIYGHYDVQPEEPLDLWKSPPFEPRIEGENIFARGATDDKGQVFAHIKAVEAHIKSGGVLPVNVIFLIEGEEEVGSNHLDTFIKENRNQLKSDVALVSDSSQFAPGLPSLCYGLRGICGEEIRVVGASHDLHSGSFGGAVPNPANILCEIIGRLKDEKNRVTIPGFYDEVLPLESWEKKAFAALPWDDEKYRKELGLSALHGEEGFTTLERKWARPTLDVNGIFGGYSGEGGKTVIPSWAGAKITMRLVPNQKPETIHERFRAYIQQLAPPSVRIEFPAHGGCGPALVPRSAPFIDEAVDALTRGFGAKPVFIREGGSIPVVLTFKEELGLNTLLLGYGLPDDNMHAPNEKFSLKDFERGIQTSAWFFQLCGSRCLMDR